MMDFRNHLLTAHWLEVNRDPADSPTSRPASELGAVAAARLVLTNWVSFLRSWPHERKENIRERI